MNMAAIIGEGSTWAVWAPGFYYELKKRTGVTDKQAEEQMVRWNAQNVGSPNFAITRAQANELKLICTGKA